MASSSKEFEEVEDIEEDLAQLGAPDYEGNGMLEFDYFLKIFQISATYGKSQFKIKKKDMMRKRREALDAGNEKEYENIVMMMNQEEEMLVKSKLMEIMK
jgi:hypothetical protein